jgi:hypothetical protein
MDIDTILEKWNHAKKQNLLYEKECDKYKDAIERYMKRKNISTINGKYYNVSKRSNTRQQLSKQSVPQDIWDLYATKITYNSYYLSQK